MANAQVGGSGAPPPRARRTPLGAFVYWTAVLSVWGLIFGAGFLAVFATGLPDTSKLYDVSRQPSITYLDRSGALIHAHDPEQFRRILLNHVGTSEASLSLLN